MKKKEKKQSIVIDEIKWPSEIRLLVNRVCNFNCSFPQTCFKWCHENGVQAPRRKKEEAVVEDFIFLAESLRKPFGLTKVKIAAMEPLLFPRLGDLIKGLKRIGYKEVSLTTNGFFLPKRAGELKRAGLDTLTVSIHAFRREVYEDITSVDGFERALKGIEKARKLGIKNIKVNRVMLNFGNVWEDLMKFLDWAATHDITVKLYQLIWSRHMDQRLFFKNYFSWRSLLVFLAKRAKLRMIKRYLASRRERLFWELDSGLKIETDIFYHKFSQDAPSVCRNCPMTLVCQEGIFSYGLEVNSDLGIFACLLREELSLDIWHLVKKRKRKELITQIRNFINIFES